MVIFIIMRILHNLWKTIDNDTDLDLLREAFNMVGKKVFVYLFLDMLTITAWCAISASCTGNTLDASAAQQPTPSPESKHIVGARNNYLEHGEGTPAGEVVWEKELGKMTLNVWLEFTQEGGNVVRAGLSEEALASLHKYASAKAENCSISGDQRTIDDDLHLVRSSDMTSRALVAETITTPNGKRTIAGDEAGRLIEFIGLQLAKQCPRPGAVWRSN
jgi:hypothetical protein